MTRGRAEASRPAGKLNPPRSEAQIHKYSPITLPAKEILDGRCQSNSKHNNRRRSHQIAVMNLSASSLFTNYSAKLFGEKPDYPAAFVTDSHLKVTLADRINLTAKVSTVTKMSGFIILH